MTMSKRSSFLVACVLSIFTPVIGKGIVSTQVVADEQKRRAESGVPRAGQSANEQIDREDFYTKRFRQSVTFLEQFIDMNHLKETLHTINRQTDFYHSVLTDYRRDKVSYHSKGTIASFMYGSKSNTFPKKRKKRKNHESKDAKDGHRQDDNDYYRGNDVDSTGLPRNLERRRRIVWVSLLSRSQICFINNYLSWLNFRMIDYNPKAEGPLVQVITNMDTPSWIHCEKMRVMLEEDPTKLSKRVAKELKKKFKDLDDGHFVNNEVQLHCVRPMGQETNLRELVKNEEKVGGGGTSEDEKEAWFGTSGSTDERSQKVNIKLGRGTTDDDIKNLIDSGIEDDLDDVEDTNSTHDATHDTIVQGADLAHDTKTDRKTADLLEKIPKHPMSRVVEGVKKNFLGSTFFHQINWVRPALTFVAMVMFQNLSFVISDIDVVHIRYVFGPFTYYFANNMDLKEETALNGTITRDLPLFRMSQYEPDYVRSRLGPEDWHAKQYHNAGFFFARDLHVLGQWNGYRGDTYHDQTGFNWMYLRGGYRMPDEDGHFDIDNHKMVIMHKMITRFAPWSACACREGCHRWFPKKKKAGDKDVTEQKIADKDAKKDKKAVTSGKISPKTNKKGEKGAKGEKVVEGVSESSSVGSLNLTELFTFGRFIDVEYDSMNHFLLQHVLKKGDEDINDEWKEWIEARFPYEAGFLQDVEESVRTRAIIADAQDLLFDLVARRREGMLAWKKYWNYNDANFTEVHNPALRYNESDRSQRPPPPSAEGPDRWHWMLQSHLPCSVHYSCDGREAFKRQDMKEDGLWMPLFPISEPECDYRTRPEIGEIAQQQARERKRLEEKKQKAKEAFTRGEKFDPLDHDLPAI